MAWIKIVGTLMSLVFAASANPILLQSTGMTSALMYLTKFGYMDPALTNPNSGVLLSAESVHKSIKKFQAFAGLSQTGELDDKTKEMMNTPRCGVKDLVGSGSEARKKRYDLQGSRWHPRILTYTISKYPKSLFRGDVDREIAAAFKVWQDITNLSFKRVSGGSEAHFEISFVSGEHGDGYPFDGPGKTLAHAFFPIFGGDSHFDDTETWTIGTSEGTNLFLVAVHEFGHALGLYHSDVKSAVMTPFYSRYQENFKLDPDDVLGIQSLYGEKYSHPAPPTAAPTHSSSGGTLCTDGGIDAIVTMSDKQTYVFKGSEYWKLTDNGVEAGYPRSIFRDWGGLPSNLDAAFTWTNGKTYFFKGGNYWRFTNLEMDFDYPNSINKFFTGIPDDIDAAFVWSGNRKIYFFKGNKYWKFDPEQSPPVKSSYPKPVSNWEGLPNNIDDALQHSNGYTYFFKDGQYYRFNDRAFRVDTATPDFPRPVGYWWFGCPAAGNQVAPTENRGNLPPPTSGDAQEDIFDADGSDDDYDLKGLAPRVSGSRTLGYQEAGTSGGSFIQPITLILVLLTTLLLKT